MTNKQNQNELQLQPVEAAAGSAVPVTGTTEFLLNPAVFHQLQRAAALYSESGLVPDAFRKNVAACFVGLQLAAELRISPFMLFQKLYIIRGKPAIESQLAIALANRAGVFTSPIEYHFEGEGENRKCTASAVLATSKKRVEATVSWKTVEAEGWANRDGSKWRTMPDLMFRYRSAMWLIRTYCPEIILGLHARDELEDAIDITPEPVSAQVAIGAAIASTIEPAPALKPPEEKVEPAPEPKPNGKPEPKAKPVPKPEPTPAQPEPQAEAKPAESEPEPKPAPKTEGGIPADEIRKALEEIGRLMPDKKKIPVATSRALGQYKRLSECSYDDLLKIIAYLERQR